MSKLDIALSFAGLGVEVVCLALLFYRRIYRIVPVFTLYLSWTIASDLVIVALSEKYAAHNPALYTQIYNVESSLTFLMQFAVLVELAWAVLRPIRIALPRRTIVVIGLVFLLVGVAMWPVTNWVTLPYADPQYHTLMRLQQAFSILRVLFVFVLAGFSQLLAIGWRDRELQIATGLGFYSLSSLAAAILHTHHASSATYHAVDQIVSFSYLCSLVYWSFSFAQQEAPRKNFPAKMENFLLAVSGAAQADRLKLEQFRHQSTKK